MASNYIKLPVLGGSNYPIHSVQLSDGSINAPSLSFTNDTGSGLYRSGAGKIAFAIGGFKAMEIGLDGGSDAVNVSIGDGVSSSSQYPLFIERDQTANTLFLLSNPNTANNANGVAGIVVQTDAGNNYGQFMAQPNAQSAVHGYQNRIVFRATVGSAGLSFVSDTDASSTTRFYTGGVQAANELLRITSTGVTLSSTGNISVNTHLAFEVMDVTTQGSKPWPVMTTTQKNALTASEGMVVYDSSLHKVSYYNGSTWTNL